MVCCGVALLGLLAAAVQRVAEVVIGVLLRGEPLGVGGRFAAERFLKRLGGLRELARLVGRRAGVELQIRLLRIAFAAAAYSRCAAAKSPFW